MSKKLIIFDMDGTLIDSGDVISKTINYVRKNIGLDDLPKDIILKNINNPDINSSQFFYQTQQFTSKQTEFFSNYYDKHCQTDITLYDGIYELLEYLKNNNFNLSVATNASSQFANKMLKSMNITKFFSFVVGADMVDNPKPNPDMLEYTLKKLNIDIKDAIFVGDSLKDTQAAKAIDMDSILINWGFSRYEDEISDINCLIKELLK